mmetsp:Transcript_7188/g.11298  ORF Transcript_7188/g.11298 Transcript_7188/m.11298 type:complete len:367 (+) Transcript_7188:39-1139(+)
MGRDGLLGLLWAGFSYTRRQCLVNEAALLDHLLKHKGIAWKARDTPVSTVADDVVHSVSINPDHLGGVDLVLVHGFANGGGCFFPILAALGKVGRTHVVDWRGAGMSGRPRAFPPRSEQEAIAYLVEGLETWRVAHLGPDGRFVLLGHSMGAIISTKYAEKYPQHVQHLLLAGPAGMKRSDTAQLDAFFNKTWIRRAVSRAWSAGVTPQMVLRALPGRLAPSFVRWYVNTRWQGGSGEPLSAETVDIVSSYATGVLMMRGCSERCLCLLLQPVAATRSPIGDIIEHRLPPDIPVDIIYGDKDWMSPAHGVEVVKRMKAAGRENVEIHVLPNAGHYPFICHPRRCIDVIAGACAAAARTCAAAAPKV